MGQHIKQDFRVTFGVDMPMIIIEKVFFQCFGIGQVSVMHQDDSKRRVDIKRLSFLVAVGVARSWITHLTQPTIAGKGAHIPGAKYVPHHAFRFVHEKLAFLLGHNSSSVLTAML